MSALLLPNEILSMTSAAVRRLVEAGDGDCALLYLAMLEAGGDIHRAGLRLGWPLDRIRLSHHRLVELELAAGQPEPLEAAPEPSKQEARPPEYTLGDVADAMEREPEFMGLYQEMQRLLGRELSDHDLKCLYTVYDHLALPVEVILMLTGYIVQTARRQRGGHIRMPQIQREAFRWKRLGIETVERAEEYLRQQQRVDAREWEILSIVGVTQHRAAVEREREFINQWVSMDIGDPLIGMAYERTVYQKGAMNWPYMNKILQSWHKAGYHTPEEVKAGDRPRRGGNASPAKGVASYQPSGERIQQNADWLDRFLAEQEKGG